MTNAVTFLSRDQIRAANDTQYESVPTPEWGGKVRVRSLTAAQREQYAEWVQSTRKKAKHDNVVKGGSAKLTVMTVVDDTGALLLTDDDIAWLQEKCSAAVGRIADVVLKMNGLAKEEEDELGNDSGTDQSDASPSA